MAQLDALRFAAIVPVLVDHLWVPGPAPWLFADVRLGVLGVRMFFVLSGFLITGILLSGVELERVVPRLRFTRAFYIRRALRIAPLYFISLAAIVAADQRQYHAIWPWAAGFATNVYVFVNQQWVGALGPLWSLAVQEQFYLVWPWLVLFVPRRLLVRALAMLLLAAPLFRLWASYRLGMSNTVQTIPLAVGDSLAMGAVVALAVHAGRDVSSHARRLVPVALAASLGLLALAHYGVCARASFALFDTTTAMLLGALVYAASVGFGGPVGRVLESRPLVYLGRISYGIYLFHAPVGGALSTLRRHVAVPYGQGGFLYFAAGLAVSVVLAVVSWELFEKSISQLKRHFPYERPEAARVSAALVPARALD
jgi:peptidoglycan/LPS O-acetylase OafA/YrhL